MNTSMKSNKQLSTALTYVVLILGSIIMISVSYTHLP